MDIQPSVSCGPNDAGHLGRLRYGALQRSAVAEKVALTMAAIEAEIEATRDPSTGAVRYTANGGRLSFAGFCRRASVDKNTLSLRDYHRELRDEVDGFLMRMQIKVGSRPPRRRLGAGVRNAADPPRSGRAAYAALAEEAQLLKRALAERDVRIAELEAALRGPLHRKGGRGHDIFRKARAGIGRPSAIT